MLPYVGNFNRPQYYGDPIPRIHVDHYAYDPSQVQRQRWAADAPPSDRLWTMAPHPLELTVTLNELLDFVDWVVAWTRAVDTNDPALLLPLPHPLERARSAEELLRTYYEWTVAAHTEYHRRRRARAEWCSEQNPYPH